MTRLRLVTGIGVTFVVVLALGAGNASAVLSGTWRIHNGNDASLITPPPGGTEQQTCQDRLSGATGWTTFVASDPPVFDPIPAAAFTAVNYEVWKAPLGFTDFGEAQEVFDPITFETVGYNFIDPITSNPIPATQVRLFTTPLRTELPTPIAVNGGSPTGDVYVFTSAPIDKRLAGVVPGDVLGVKPTGGATFINLTAVQCSPSYYVFGGFNWPVNDPPTVNVGKAGDSYLVRFQLRDSNGGIVNSLSAVSAITPQRVACSLFTNKPKDLLEQSTTGTSQLKFSSSADRFVYRWKTPVNPGCFKLNVVFDTGQRETALFRLN